MMEIQCEYRAELDMGPAGELFVEQEVLTAGKIYTLPTSDSL